MSQCLYCERRVHARKMCQAHWARWWRNGDPLRKYRRRGILDAEPVPVLGPLQKQIILALVQRQGQPVARCWLPGSFGGFYGALDRIRKNYGPVVKRNERGYYIEPETAKRLLVEVSQ